MILRLVLGALLAAMALGQLLSLHAMPDLLGAYGLTAVAASTALAMVLIAAQRVGGAWLLARPRVTAMVPVWIFIGVSAVWAVLAVQAYARGLPVPNCGCFGTYLTQPLRWFVLIEDALMLTYGVLLLRATRRRKNTPATRRTERISRPAATGASRR